ncbi:bacteriochlorophyll c-binding family protein [Chlorobium ferrooxidans]|nr:bacteriochlorophyll c-binding family protein [Chlorobium ferrooxidans]
MNKTEGAFVQGAEAYGRLVEVFVDGTWWIVGDYLENVGKCTKRLGANAYPYLYGGSSLSSSFRGSSPVKAGYAKPSKEVQRRFGA